MRAPAHKSTKRTRLPLAALIANPKNYKVHTISQLTQLQSSLKRFGQPREILVRAANKQIIAGHGLAEAMKLAGETEADVLLWDVDQKTADAFMVADNKLATLSNDDDDALAKLLAEMDPEDVAAVGFVPEEVEKLLAGTEDVDLIIREIETDAVSDRYWISVVGPLKDQAVALRRLQDAMVDLTDTTVELGTTPG